MKQKKKKKRYKDIYLAIFRKKRENIENYKFK